MVSELFTSPGTYLQRKVRERSLWREAVVVFVVGVLGSVGHYYLLQRYLESVETAGYTLLNGVGIVIAPIGGIFVFWIGSAILAHVLANYTNSRGPIRRLIKLSAWATVPIGIGNALRSAAVFIAYRDVEPDEINIDANSFDVRYAEFQDLHMTDPIVVGASVLLILSFVWAGYILSIGVRSSKQGISQTEARVVAAVPTGLFVLYFVYVLGSRLGVL